MLTSNSALNTSHIAGQRANTAPFSTEFKARCTGSCQTATATMRPMLRPAKAACQVARAHEAPRVVLAAPVAPEETRQRFAGIVDELVVLATPSDFTAVGQFYADFAQVPDDAVLDLLDPARRNTGASSVLSLRGPRRTRCRWPGPSSCSFAAESSGSAGEKPEMARGGARRSCDTE